MSKKNKKKTFSIFVVLACILFIAGIQVFDRGSDQAGSIALARVKGTDRAPIKITEYIDFQCSLCAEGSKHLKEFIKAHPDKIRLELKYFPLNSHQHALMSARYAQCAANQGKFWEFHDLVLERQSQWQSLANATPAFDDIAGKIGLDQAQLNSCLKDEAVGLVINLDKEEGARRGVRSTPTYFINGKMFVGHKSLASELDRLLTE